MRTAINPTNVSERIFAPTLLTVQQEITSLVLDQRSAFAPNWKSSFFDEEISSLRKTIEEWIHLKDLKEYSFFSLEDGVTGCLNKWIAEEKRPIQMFEGDYKWISCFKKNIKYLKSIEEINKNSVLYVSNPSAIDGNYLSHWDEILSSNAPIVLDCVYYGAAASKNLKLTSNVEKVFFSLSKNFGLSRFRAGFSFSRFCPWEYRAIQHYGYYNYLTTQIIPLLAQKFPIDYLYRKLHLTQNKVCKELGLLPSHVVYMSRVNNLNKEQPYLRTRYCITDQLIKKEPKLFIYF